MGSLLLSWVVFPGVMSIICLGCGLLVERAATNRIHGALLLPLGFALIVIVSVATTFADATAELTVPLVVVVTALGFILTGRRGEKSKVNRWCAAAGLLTFAFYAAPIVLTGESTFGGYQKLDDTSNWLAAAQHLLEDGRSLEALAPSTYSQALSMYIGNWYPIGSYPPLAVGSALSGQNLAWTVQPYMAYLAAMLAMTLTVIARSFLDSWAKAALVGVVAAQPALLVGYVFWGGIKEIAGAVLLALVSWFAVESLKREAALRDMVPLIVAGAAMFFALSFGSGAWLLPLPFLGVLLLLRDKRSVISILRPLAIVVGAGILVLLPFVATGKLGPSTFDSLTNPVDALGNLVDPLTGWRLFGIWPAGDFRFPTELPVLTTVAIGAAVLAAVGALVVAWRRRAWPVVFMFAASASGGLLVWLIADAWIGGKAMAMSAPGFLLVAMLGAVGLWGSRAKVLGYGLTLLIAGSVLLSNGWGVHEMTLAPRDQLGELEEIADVIGDEGPTLMTEYQPYGVRYFLRDADPEGVSDLRVRNVPLINGGTLQKSEFADTDELDLPGLQVYRTLVLRRSPAASRPPAEYELIWSGRYYEVWQRPVEPAANVTRLSLGQTLAVSVGGSTTRVDVPDCQAVLDLAAQAGPGSRLVAQPGTQAIPIDFAAATLPDGWTQQYGNYVIPSGSGTLETTFKLPDAGNYGLWLGGSIRGSMVAKIDGEEIASAAHEINNLGQYIPLGSADLSAGIHNLELEYSRPFWRPGSGGPVYTAGPLLLGTAAGSAPDPVVVGSEEAESLCDREWDWIEVQS